MKVSDGEMERFIDEKITVKFDIAPLHSKAPGCPSGFYWQGKFHLIVAELSHWVSFERRGLNARNMQSRHARVAAGRGSLGVGRYFYLVQLDTAEVFMTGP